jgi:hypothetical protein
MLTAARYLDHERRAIRTAQDRATPRRFRESAIHRAAKLATQSTGIPASKSKIN